MMGLGYLGSSSSSNLSPLAPPFTVDRSNHNKPFVNSNPVSHYNDPSYAAPFTSSWPYSHSTSARQEFLGDSPRTTALSSNDYGYLIPDPINPPSTHNWSGTNSNGLEQITPARSHWAAVNPSPKRVADSLSYNLSEAKPFYPPYASWVKNDDIPLVSFSETSCDLLSTSGLVHGDETDYTRSLSGLEYNPNPQQEGLWSRLPLTLPEGKPVKKMETGDSFFSEEANIAASLAYNSYLNQGAAYGTETLGKGKDDPSMFYYADIIRRANKNGKTDVFANNHEGLNHNELSKGGSKFGAFSIFSESHPPVLIQSAPEDPFKPPYEKRYHNMFEITKSSPLVIKPPVSAQTPTASSKNLNITSDVKEKGGSFLPPNQLSFQMGTTDIALRSSTKQDMLSSASDQLTFEFKAKPSFLQLPDINIPNANSNSFDHHDSPPAAAEDSPCWKGAPPFLPFGSPLEAQPQHPTKKLQKVTTNLQGTDINPSSSSGPSIPFEKQHIDTGEVVVSLKVSSGDDIIKPNPKQNLPNPEAEEDTAATKKVNASIVVKSLYNLSDLLLRDCSNALTEHDYEALDHVIHNLGLCMSTRQVQVAASTHKLTLHHSNISQEVAYPPAKSHVVNETSGGQAGEHHARHQEPKSDVFGKNVEKLLEHASLRNFNPPKDDIMIQAIKKVLVENLECEVELPSETLLYKNLWLETEAELCSLSYRARFERLKRETQKEKSDKSTVTGGDASAIKEISSCCNGSTDLKADNSKVSNAHIDDVEASVMARFNIHGEQTHVKNVEDGQVAGVEVTASGVSVQHHPCKGKDDIDPWVMARLNILKHRGESNANAIDFEERDCCEERECHSQDDEEEESSTAAVGSVSDWEHILKDEFSWRLS